ncbi:MAG TPA: NAD-dependent epimerase [Peptococcaceae bacterium]|nr:NAD-dependent epimerase [Peptococcaceae bacterium]
MIQGYQELDPGKIYFVTGSAGFIGFFLCKKLLEQGCRVIGLDNLNPYYDVTLKEYRLKLLEKFEGFKFIPGDLADKRIINKVFAEYRPQIVVNLAAQAGVRYSLQNPDSYIQSNIVGFYNILEACRHYPVEHLVYASSSSVYGGNTKVPFSTEDKVDNPVSLYAATKKSNELMAHTYSHLFGIPCTGLRFFTVYGPLGRPDMAYFSFTNKILKGEPIQVFNYGDCYRDFTYIDDIIEAVVRVLCNPPARRDAKGSILDGLQYAVYNIGNNRPEHLLDFIAVLEKALSKALGREIVAQKEFLPMQPGDVKTTYSDSSPLERDFGFKPSTSIEEGLQRFVEWYVEYYGLRKDKI